MATKKPRVKKANKKKEIDHTDVSEATQKWAIVAAIGGGVVIVILLIVLALPKDIFVNDSVPEEPTPTVQDKIQSATWDLVGFEQNGQELPIPQEAQVTLTIDGNQLGGVSACNNYFGSFELVDGVITMSPMGSTKKACIDNSIMSFESDYLDVLQAVSSFDTPDDNTLILYSGEAKEDVLTFEITE